MNTATKIIPNIGLTSENRQKLWHTLNVLLADEHLIYTKTRKAHWNITGIQFYSLHEMLEDQYNELQTQADEIAERTRMLGGEAIGTMSEFIQHTRLEEQPNQNATAEDMMRLLLEDHEQLVAYLRNDIEVSSDDYHDEGTADLLVGIMRMHEQMAWMLRSTLNA